MSYTTSKSTDPPARSDVPYRWVLFDYSSTLIAIQLSLPDCYRGGLSSRSHRIRRLYSGSTVAFDTSREVSERLDMKT